MNKKLIAVAVGSALGALGAPSVALAQSSTVTLSGNINVYYGYFDNGGAGNNKTTVFSGTGNPQPAKVKTDGMVNSESEWVMAGQENLGGGLSAFFRCATTLDVWGQGTSNMCGRTSYLGLKGRYGSMSWGNNDTPHKRMIGLYDPFPISATHGQSAMMFNGVSSALGNTNASFSRRQTNLITYDMPTMNGFDAAFAWTSSNEATAATAASTISKPRLWSAMVNYTNGPLMLGASYERHIDYNPAAFAATASYAGGKDSSYQFGASYTFGGSFKLSGIYVHMDWDNVTPGLDTAVNTWGVYGDWAISGPHKLRLGYNNQGDTKGSYSSVGTNNLLGSYTANAGAGSSGASKYVIEYGYGLSKRTEISAHYARVSNDRFSNISVGSGANTPNYGESQSAISLRVQHRF